MISFTPFCSPWFSGLLHWPLVFSLQGAFSRYDYQRTAAPSSIKSFKAVLPAAASDVYYRDEIGNISTSNLWSQEDSVELELRPRFPLFGGWQTRFYMGYNVPSYEYLYNLGKWPFPCQSNACSQCLHCTCVHVQYLGPKLWNTGTCKLPGKINFKNNINFQIAFFVTQQNGFSFWLLGCLFPFWMTDWLIDWFKF